MSFININNREELNTNSYTKQMIQRALYVTETKNVAKIKTLTEGLNRFTPLNEALTLFTNKLGAMSALSQAKVQLGGTLNEGQFSWMTQDSGEQIGSERENRITVYMYDNAGNQYKEDKYEGYGEFGGMDYYDLVAKMNGYTEEDLESVKGSFKELRQLGIDLAFGKLKTKDKKGKTLFPALVTDPRYNWKRHDFTQEAENDPNQSWYQEPEYDDYEDEYDYDSDEYYESMKTNIKFHKTITKKEWDKTQKDSKTIIDGTHYMMFLDDDKGTILAPVEVTESEDKEVNEGLPDSFLGLPLETFADYYAALDVALGIGIGGVIAGAVLAKLGLDAGIKLFKKGKKAVEDWYTKNGGEVTEGNAFGAARAEAIAKGEKEFTVDGETYPVEDVDQEDKENAEEFANEGKLNELSTGAYRSAMQAGLDRGDSRGDKIAKDALDSLGSALAKELVGQVWEVKSAPKPEALYVSTGFRGDAPKHGQYEIEFTGNGRFLNVNPKEVIGSSDVSWLMEVIVRPGESRGWGSDFRFTGYRDYGDKAKAYVQFSIRNGRVEVYTRGSDFSMLEFTRGGARKLADLANVVALELEMPIKIKHNSIKQFDPLIAKNENLNWEDLKESLGLTEGRSIAKIQKEWGAVTLDMKKTVEEWKAAEGDRKAELLDKLKALTSEKKSLESELNDAVGLKDADAELAESLDEAKAVKDFDKAVLDATTEEEVKEIYPNAEFFVSKMTHGFAELAPNLFMKYYYTKGTDFKVHKIYTEKGRDKYVDLFNLDESDKKKLKS